MPEDGTYAINLDFYKKPSNEDVPMFVDINGDSAHPYRMMLPASNYNGGAPGSRASALFELKAGENTLRFYNPIRSSNRDYDTARYNYKFMSTNLMQATEKYAEENGKKTARSRWKSANGAAASLGSGAAKPATCGELPAISRPTGTPSPASTIPT